MKIKQNWSEFIDAWKISGLSKQAFCKSKGIPYHSFLYHVNKKINSDSGGFRQVVLQNLDGADRIEFHFPDGRCVCFPVSTPKEIVRFLVSL